MSSFRMIGLIGAMVEEVEKFHGQLSEPVLHRYAGMAFTEGFIEGQHVIVCKSGVGKVNAAMCAQILKSQFSVDAVIMTGVAGALDPRLDIGDLVISLDCMQHDMDVTALGFARGVIPFAEHSLFPADASLIRSAQSAAEQEQSVQTLTGRVLSGDQFIADREKVNMFYEQLGGCCTEMEGAAVAQVCFLNNVPFVIIRSISDRADGSAHVNFAEFTPLAAERSSRLVNHILKQMK